MPVVIIPIEGIDKEELPQLEYALTFASEDIISARIIDSAIEAHITTEGACESASQKINELLRRFSKAEFGLRRDIHFSQERVLPVIDAWNGLLERRLVTPVGQGPGDPSRSRSATHESDRQQEFRESLPITSVRSWRSIRQRLKTALCIAARTSRPFPNTWISSHI